MPVKTIKTKRRLLYAVYRNLKSVAPREFATTEEIKATIQDILPELEGSVEKFNNIIERAGEVNAKLTTITLIRANDIKNYGTKLYVNVFTFENLPFFFLTFTRK